MSQSGLSSEVRPPAWSLSLHDCLSSEVRSGIFICVTNYVLKSLKNSLTTSILTTIYYSMIHPYISYGLMLWRYAYKSYLHMIEILQKQAIRNVHKTKYNEHTMPLFRSSKILKIEDMYKLQLLMFMFSYYRNILPSPLY